MAQNLWQKSRLVVLAVAHKLLDKAIDMNDVGAVKQMVRDLEVSKENLGDTLAEARGAEQTAKMQHKQLQEELVEANVVIDQLLTDADPDNDHFARSKMAQVVGLEGQIKLKNDEISATSETAASIKEAWDALRVKHEAMKSQLALLEAKSATADAKENAAEALNAAARMSGVGAGASVDSIQERIDRRSNTANERFKMAVENFGDVASEDEAIAEVEARLSQRKEELAKEVAPAAAQ